jgi:PEP-CTERM motif
MKALEILAGMLLAALTMQSAPAGAQTIYDNLYATSDGAESLASAAALGDSFTFSGPYFHFTTVSLVLDATDPQDGGFFSVSVCSAYFIGTPNCVLKDLGDFSDSILSTSPTLVTISFLAILLPAQADYTTYWIELNPLGFSSANWLYSSDNSAYGVAGQQWLDANGVFPNDSGHGPFQMLVAGIPEPSTWAMMLIGFASLGYVSWRRATRAKAAAA